MKYLRMIVDNKTALVAFVLAALGLAGSFGLDLSESQQSNIMLFLGALIGLLAVFTTETKAKIVSLVDRSGIIRNGQASTGTTGTPTPVVVNDDGSLVPQTTVDPALAVAGPKAA